MSLFRVLEIGSVAVGVVDVEVVGVDLSLGPEEGRVGLLIVPVPLSTIITILVCWQSGLLFGLAVTTTVRS